MDHKGFGFEDSFLISQWKVSAAILPATPCAASASAYNKPAASPREWDFRGNLLGDKAVSVVFDCAKLKRAVPGFDPPRARHACSGNPAPPDKAAPPDADLHCESK